MQCEKCGQTIGDGAGRLIINEKTYCQPCATASREPYEPLYQIRVALTWPEYNLLQSRMLPQDHELSLKLAAAMDVARENRCRASAHTPYRD